MSFTEDELEAFNTVLDQRLSAHRKDLERLIDAGINEFRRDTEQRITAAQQETVRILVQKLSEYQNRVDTVLSERLSNQQMHFTRAIGQDAEQRQQQFESSVDRLLAAQLLGIEQLLSQQLSLETIDDKGTQVNTPSPQLEAIEVQTELPWEDLMDVIGKVLDERLTVLNESTQRSLRNLEQYLSVRLHSLRDEFLRSQIPSQSYNGNMTSVQEVLHGIEHLERIVESMQVAMTSNNALLSNRLFHHQQLPLERAHPGNHLRGSSEKSTQGQPPLARKPVAHGLEPEMATTQEEVSKEE